MIKYIKSVLWRVAKCLSYIEEARCLKVNLEEDIEASGQLQAPAALPRYPLTTRMSGCQKWSGRVGDKKKICPCWNLNTGSPAHGQSIELTVNIVNYDILSKKTGD